uniref:Uncharacterized protein n=1 Tax=Anopheles culicifacies TaxID=139723 RepID=A0A182MIA6_9DIPT
MADTREMCHIEQMLGISQPTIVREVIAVVFHLRLIFGHQFSCGNGCGDVLIVRQDIHQLWQCCIADRTCNVPLDPLQNQQLIFKSSVPCYTCLWEAEKSKRPESIVERDDHYTLLHKINRIVQERVTASTQEPSTVDVHHHRQSGCICTGQLSPAHI